MKIAVIIDTWFPAIGGGQVNTWEISKRIAKKGHKIDIITRDNGNYKHERITNLNIYRLGKTSKSYDNLSRLIFLFSSFFFINKKDYDIIHLQAFLPGLLSPIIRYLLKKPTVFTVHGTRMFEQYHKFSLGFLLEKVILTKIRYDAQISVTKAFIKFKNVNNKIINIANGVDRNKFNEVKVEQAKYPKILWVGRFDPVKRVEDLILAMKIINSKIPEAGLTLVGYGSEEENLKRLTKELNIKNIEFAGKKENKDLIKEYKSSHVFVLCSQSEGQPLTILEALAAKLPVVATRVGGIPEIIEDGVNGVLIENLSPEEIAKALIKALKNHNRFHLIIPRHFDWDFACYKTLQLYKNLNEQIIV